MKRYTADELIRNNLIDDETYDRIVSFEKSKSSNKMTVNLFFNILAGILIALGVIWIVAANWHNIPNSVRLLVVFTATIINAVIIVKMKLKGKNLEAPSIVYVGLNIASIALIGQVFNIASNTELFLLVCVLFMGVVPFYTKSKLLSYAYMIFGTIYLFAVPNIIKTIFTLNSNSIFYNNEIGRILSIVLYVIIPLCYLKFVLRDKTKDGNEIEEKNDKRYVKVLIDTVAILLVSYSINLTESAGLFMLFAMVLFTIFKFFNLKTERKICSAAIFVYLLTASIEEVEYMIDFNVYIIIFILAYIGIMINNIIKKNNISRLVNSDESNLNFKNKLQDTKNDLIFLSSGILIILNVVLENCLVDINGIGELFTYIYLIYLIGFAIYLIVNGIKENRISDFNLGEFIFGFEIFRFIFMCSDNLMLRGILSIIIAVIILKVNKKVANKIKENNVESNQNELKK